MIQTYAWQLTVLLVAIVAIFFVLVAVIYRDSSINTEHLIKKSYRVRDWLFWAILIVITPVIIYTLTVLPYGIAASHSGEIQKVDVTGQMWQWHLSKSRVEVGRPVRFYVTSKDVNHGFGIYDSDLRLLTQTQAMPGYINILEYTFEHPGVYKVLCMEYCGIAHHKMTTGITVVD